MKTFFSLWTTAITVGLIGPVQAQSGAELPTVRAPTLTLRDALNIAAGNSVALKQSRADAAAASASAESARAQERPTLSTTTYGTVGDSSNILTTSPGVTPQNLFSVAPRGFADQNLMLMVPLYTGGRLEGASASAQKQGEAAELGVQAAQLTVADTVTEDYTVGALRQALVGVAQARLDAENEQVRVTQEKVKTGRLAPVDLLREQAEQADARQALLSAQNDAAEALIVLKTALGVSQASSIILSDTLDALAGAMTLPATLPEALHWADTRRQEFQAALRQVGAAQGAVDAVRGEYAPQVYGVAMGDLTAGQGIGRAGYTLGITASLPLLDGGQRRAEMDTANARRERAQADAQQARQMVDQDVATAWLMVQTATAQGEAATEGVTAAQEGYDLANLRYNAGKTTTAERLDALSALVRAQGMMEQAKAALVTARARLLAASGDAPAPP